MKRSIQVLGLCLVIVLLWSFQVPTTGYQPGDKAMNFNLLNVDGKMVRMQDNPAVKGYVVVFTCNTCPVAQAYESRIMALDKQYAAKGYPVIAINANDSTLSPGDSYAEMKKRSQSKRYSFPYLWDETQEVAKAFGARATPTVYVLKRVGSDFVVRYLGAIDNSRDDAQAASDKYVQQAVDALLANQAIEKPIVKAVGCGIRWKRV